MIKVDDVRMFDDSNGEKSVFACIESHIDGILKDRKTVGMAVVDMMGTVPGRTCDTIELRHWVEIARRYAASGWDVTVRDGAQHRKLVIASPAFRFPEPHAAPPILVKVDGAVSIKAEP
jgi:hypothetical protein